MILVLARREWAAAFRTPFAWLMLAASQATLAWVFLEVLDRYARGDTSSTGVGINTALSTILFGATALLLLLIAPVLAARSLGDEIRYGTDQLLGAAPVQVLAIVVGKLAGLALSLLALCLLPLGLCLSLLGVAPIDVGHFAAATLGLWLTALLFASIGLFTASITRQPALAAIVAWIILIMLSLIGDADQLAGTHLSLLDWLSWSQHLFWFLTGLVRISDLSYFLMLTLVFLALTHRHLLNQRLG